MARANRYLLPGQISHLTHRCHNRAFLLRFARDRDAYRFWLREALRRFPVTLLGYCVTSNHVHLIVQGATAEAVSEMMGLLEGRVAQQYNRRKGREGAFWSDRFHATMIDTGEHFWNCLSYVDLNMVRTGAVADPRQWRCCGYAELIGTGSAKPLVNWDRVADLLGRESVGQLRTHWKAQIRCCLEVRRLQREGFWTESVAVGRREYVEWVISQVRGRAHWQIAEQSNGVDGSKMWSVRETGACYG